MERHEYFSRHGRTRAAQRNFSPEEISFIIAHGRTIYGCQALIKFLGRRDIPLSFHRQYGNLIGSVVVLSPKHKVITVYMHRGAVSRLKRNAFNYRRSYQQTHAPRCFN